MSKFKKIICPKCKHEICSNAFWRHEPACKGLGLVSKNIPPSYLKINDKFQCPFCFKFFKNPLAVGTHIRCAHKNNSPSKNNSPWNKGKTKETDVRIANKKNPVFLNPPRPWTNQRKSNHRVSMKKAVKNFLNLIIQQI